MSFKVEEALPSLPSLATLACNSTNSNFEACGELELMSHLTLEAARHGSGMDWDAVSCSICTGGSVAAYAKSIGQYVKLYSGGPGSPLVHFLVAFAKSYAAKVTLGQELFKVWRTPNSCKPNCCLSLDWLCSQQIWLHLLAR